MHFELQKILLEKEKIAFDLSNKKIELLNNLFTTGKIDLIPDYIKSVF